MRYSTSLRNIIPAGAVLAAGLVAAFWGASCLTAQDAKKKGRTAPEGYSDTPVLPGQKWRVHDIARPKPPMVTPAPIDRPGAPPSDAIVLFDGKDLSKWTARGKGKQRGTEVQPGWKVENGYMEVVGGAGDLVSKDKFGDIQLHLEWWTPPNSPDSSQWKGNSGVMLMGRYEIQILDSVNNPTYADGQAGAIYGQWPPLVNPARKAGEWQVYDLVFEAPRFNGDKVVKPAYVTLFFNGVLVHNKQEILGPVAHRKYNLYSPHPPEEPLVLQDHDVTVRFRNIWVRRLKGYDQQ